ncbi:MAG TPA: hypothetical protein VFK06_24865 [Candidatus Angelobacter sp.]|nr:hypothetical protein [Candidatus Angelobacter sp.]
MDQSAFQQTGTLQTLLTPAQVQAWQSFQLTVNQTNNAISLFQQDSDLQGAQIIGVHGWTVTPNFCRSEPVRINNTPPVSVRETSGNCVP